jgi:hypothetical protein
MERLTFIKTTCLWAPTLCLGKFVVPHKDFLPPQGSSEDFVCRRCTTLISRSMTEENQGLCLSCLEKQEFEEKIREHYIEFPYRRVFSDVQFQQLKKRLPQDFYARDWLNCSDEWIELWSFAGPDAFLKLEPLAGGVIASGLFIPRITISRVNAQQDPEFQRFWERHVDRFINGWAKCAEEYGIDPETDQ